MGCGPSKGVVPEPGNVAQQNDDVFKGTTENDTKPHAALPTVHTQEPVSTAQKIIPAKQSCAEKLAFADAAPEQQHASSAKQQLKQADSEFGYDDLPGALATAKSTAVPSQQSVGITPLTTSSNAAAVQAVQESPSTAVVGGLLSRQPDWLRQDSSKAPSKAMAPVALFSNSASGGKDATASSTAAVTAASNAVSSLPPISRGFCGPDSAGISRSLFEKRKSAGGFAPLSSDDLAQQSITAPAGAAGASAAAAVTAELPAPRRITASHDAHRPSDEPPVRSRQHSIQVDAGSSTSQQLGFSPPVVDDTGNRRSSSTAAAAQQEQSCNVLNRQATSSSLSHSSDDGSGDVECPDTFNSTGVPEPVNPSDPWSALQSHVAAVGPTSPDTTMSGSGSNINSTASTLAPAAVAAGHRKSNVGVAASVGAASTRRVTGEGSELVLMDSEDSDTDTREALHSHRSSTSSHHLKKENSSSHNHHIQQKPRLHEEGSSSNNTPRHGGLTAEKSAVRAGGWGTGKMAAAGTLMLGDEATTSTASGQDDVFGENSISGGMLNSSNRGVYVQHAAAAAMPGVVAHEDELGVEEIDDVDAVIEAELAAKNALPGDLAAKLAAYEAIADDDE